MPPGAHGDAVTTGLRLLHVLPSLDPREGGPVQWVKALNRELARRGHTSSVATFDAPDAPHLAGLPFATHPLGPAAGRYRFASGAVARLRALSADHDALIVDGLWQFPGVATMNALRDGPTPYFVFPHGMLDPWFKTTYPLKHLKKLLYWPAFEQRVLRRAAAVIFTNAVEARLARSSFPGSVWTPEVVRFGIEDVPGNGDALRRGFLAKHPHLAGRRLLTYLGRIHEKKGYDLLVEAFAQVKDADPDLHLVFIGPSDAKNAARLSQLVDRFDLGRRSSRIEFVSGDEKWGALYASEAFCLPSHQENFGIAIVEALACGVPVLISDKINIHEEIAAQGAGHVATDTVQGTVQALDAWLGASAADRERMKAAARKCFETAFDIAQAADDLISIIGRRGSATPDAVGARP